jgi:hypothetical protein
VRRELRVAAAGLLALVAAPLPALADEIALSFGDAPGGASGGFRIERREAGAPRFEVLALVGPGVADFVDRGLPAAATYCYRVRALAAEPAGEWSPEVCAEAKSPPPVEEPGAAPATATAAEAPSPPEATAPAPAEGEAMAEPAAEPPAEGGEPAPAAEAAKEPGRRIRTSGGWLQVLD